MLGCPVGGLVFVFVGVVAFWTLVKLCIVDVSAVVAYDFGFAS